MYVPIVIIITTRTIEMRVIMMNNSHCNNSNGDPNNKRTCMFMHIK